MHPIGSDEQSHPQPPVKGVVAHALVSDVFPHLPGSPFFTSSSLPSRPHPQAAGCRCRAKSLLSSRGHHLCKTLAPAANPLRRSERRHCTLTTWEFDTVISRARAMTEGTK